jgi:HAD superfamily hydrolase (TIGR01549 family)
VTAVPGCIEAVVFDLDGTLADTMTLAPRVYAETIMRLGGPEVSPEEVIAAWHIGSTPVVLAHFLCRPVTAPDIECFYGSFEAVIAAVQPLPGIPGMLSALQQEGYRLAVFTHATRRAATMTLAAAGLDRFRLTLVGGEEIARPKPAPDGLQLACQRINVTAPAAAYVGDAEVDLQCAAAAGSLAIHARWCANAAAVAPHLAAGHPGDIVDLLAAHRASPRHHRHQERAADAPP